MQISDCKKPAVQLALDILAESLRMEKEFSEDDEAPRRIDYAFAAAQVALDGSDLIRDALRVQFVGEDVNAFLDACAKDLEDEQEDEPTCDDAAFLVARRTDRWGRNNSYPPTPGETSDGQEEIEAGNHHTTGAPREAGAALLRGRDSTQPGH